MNTRCNANLDLPLFTTADENIPASGAPFVTFNSNSTTCGEGLFGGSFATFMVTNVLVIPSGGENRFEYLFFDFTQPGEAEAVTATVTTAGGLVTGVTSNSLNGSLQIS